MNTQYAQDETRPRRASGVTSDAGAAHAAHAGGPGRPTVAIFRTTLGRPEQAFIFDHAASLKRYRSLLIAASTLPEFDRSKAGRTPAFILDSDAGRWGAARDLLFRVTGRSASFARVLRANSAALIHAHFGPDSVRMLRTSRQLRLPLVTTFHGFDASRADEALRRGTLGERQYLRSRHELARRGAAHIAVSHFIRDQLLERGFPGDRTTVNYLGVDAGFFRPSPAERKRATVLFVGRLDEAKGVLDLVHALAAVQVTVPEVRGVFLGAGPAQAEVALHAKRLGVRIELPGVVSRAEVRSWMQSASVLCGPSKRSSMGAREAFGLVFAEAQACELPVVAYASGGVTEAVAHGETGFLVAEGDVVELAATLCRLLGDPELSGRFGRAGRARVLRDFDAVRQSAKLEEIYDEVLARSGSWASSSGT